MTQKDYIEIKDKAKYDELLATGMFFEMYPELTGNYETDMETICLENEITFELVKPEGKPSPRLLALKKKLKSLEDSAAKRSLK